jgi:hypothetical protein
MRINDRNPEFENAELSYRRGYEHGAYDVLQLVRDGADVAEIGRWLDVDIHVWRVEGMIERMKSGRVKSILPPRRRCR